MTDPVGPLERAVQRDERFHESVAHETLPPRLPHKPRGFACISPELRRAISSKGGKAAHAQGTAHEFTPEEAKAAGVKGGYASQAARKRKEAAGGQVNE